MATPDDRSERLRRLRARYQGSRDAMEHVDHGIGHPFSPPHYWWIDEAESLLSLAGDLLALLDERADA